MIKLIIDMMGGDDGVKATIPAVKNFLAKHNDVQIFAVGNEKELEKIKDIVTILPSTSVAKMESDVLSALRDKNSSIYVAVNNISVQGADGIISAGSTGAFLALLTLINKKIEGVERPALISPFPTKIDGKNVVLLDIGASNQNSAFDLYNFALIGNIYYQILYKKQNPNIYLISNGSEEGKGTPLYQETYKLLKDNPNFKGYIEGRYVLDGNADVVVFDGFTGNIFLKTVEGTSKFFSHLITGAFKRNFFSKIGYLFSRKSFKQMKEKVNYKKVGGAFLVGVNVVAVKAHGNADPTSFEGSINIAYELAKEKMVEKIKAQIKK